MTQAPDAMPNPSTPERTAVLVITRPAVVLGGRLTAALPEAHLFAPAALGAAAETSAPDQHTLYQGPTRDLIPLLFADWDALVAVFSLGALVRLIAPHLKDKHRDPAVLVLDEAGRFVIPVLSGHLGGANALAARISAALGATPVLTTASDVQQSLAVDLLGRELGWTLEATPADLLAASAAVVNGEPVALIQEDGSRDWWQGHANGRAGPLPANLHCLALDGPQDLSPFRALLWISRRPLPPGLATGFGGALVVYRT
jgi:cobalt-precorrin 5A hydrolase